MNRDVYGYKGITDNNFNPYKNSEVNWSNHSEAYPNARNIHRGEIWTAHTNERYAPGGTQYVIVVSPENENNSKPYVMGVSIVDELTGRPRPSRFGIEIDGEIKWVICESVRRMSLEKLISKHSVLSDYYMSKLDDGLAHTVGLYSMRY